MRSTFIITTATGSAAVNYSGSYWVDPATLDLLRLDIQAEELPVQLQLATMRISVEYGTVASRDRQVSMARGSVKRNGAPFGRSQPRRY